MKRLAYLAAVCICLPLGTQAATVTHIPWGQDASGAPVELYTIKSAKAEVTVTTYGAHLVSIRVPNRKGAMGNVLLSQDSVKGYLGMGALQGATIGRYANRIDHGQFMLGDKTYQIPPGPKSIALHGGPTGFNKKTFTAKVIPDGVAMSLVSPDGDMGFPGTLDFTVSFTLTERKGNPALKIQYEATTDKETVVNFTNHAYFNLGDDPATPVLDDVARIDADKYTPFDARQIPTGEIATVEGTPFDFRTAHAIGDKAPDRGYDHSFVLRAPGLDAPQVEVDDPASGRTIQVLTTEPGLQFYVPRNPPPRPAPAGAPSFPRRAMQGSFSLETQHFPDAPNHPNFPTTVLVPGQTFHSTTIYVFGVMRGEKGKSK